MVAGANGGGGGDPPRIEITVSPSSRARVWPHSQRRSLTWAEFCAEIFDPQVVRPRSEKDGLCYVPGLLVHDRRVASEVCQIGLLVADIDCGLTLDELTAILNRSGLVWAVSSTYSHGRSEVVKRFPRVLWQELVRQCGSAEQAAQVWLTAHYLPNVAKHRVMRVLVDERQSGVVAVTMLLRVPIARFRVVLPLRVPWRPAGGPGAAAAREWPELYRLAWRGLGLGAVIDPVCGDPPRLFFAARRPAQAGTPAVFEVSTGGGSGGQHWADLAELVERGRAWIPGPVDTGWEVAQQGAQHVLAGLAREIGEAGPMRRLHGRNGGSDLVWRSWVVERADGPDQGQKVVKVDLELWHRQFAHELRLADLFAERRPDLLDDRPDSDSGRRHVLCPRSALHSSDGGGGTFCWDGSGHRPAGTPGRLRSGMHCNHTACAGMTQGRWLALLLAEGVVTWGDLDAAQARSHAARGKAAASDLGGNAGGGGDAGGDDEKSAPPAADAAPAGGAKVEPAAALDAAAAQRSEVAMTANVAAIDAGRKSGSEDDRAAAEQQFIATQRYVLAPGGRFYDLRAGGAEATQPQAASFTHAILAGRFGFAVQAQVTLARWVQWDDIRRRLGLSPCVVAGLAYEPGAGLLVPGATPQAMHVNLWRPGPAAWPQPVADNEPCVAALLALCENISGDMRERNGLLWWLGDALVRVGGERITWGPVNYGPQGCGKSTYGLIAIALVGEHNGTVVTFREFMRSGENTFLLKQIVAIEEAAGGGTRKDGRSTAHDFYDALQPFYTARVLRLSQKYVSAFDMKLHCRFVANSNSADAYAPPPDDRRTWPMRARGGRLPDELAAALYALLNDPVQISKCARWLIDMYPVLGAVHGFDPFRCPTQDVTSWVKQELIEAGLTQAGDVAVVVAREQEQAGRTVLAFSEVVEAVRARLRMEPGMRPAHQHVAEGLSVAGWALAARWREGGREGPQHRLFVLKSEIAAVGLGQLTGAELGPRWRLELAKTRGDGAK